MADGIVPVLHHPTSLSLGDMPSDSDELEQQLRENLKLRRELAAASSYRPGRAAPRLDSAIHRLTATRSSSVALPLPGILGPCHVEFFGSDLRNSGFAGLFVSSYSSTSLQPRRSPVDIPFAVTIPVILPAHSFTELEF
jgi:hypothetical protein